MKALKAFLLVLALAPASWALETIEPPRRLILPGQEAKASCAACQAAPQLILPGTEIPKTVPAVSPAQAPQTSLILGLDSQFGAPKAGDTKPDPAASLPVIFDHSAKPLADGTIVAPQIVTPELMARGQELETARLSVSRAVKQAVPALSESVRLGRWNGDGTTLDKPCCGDAAPKLGIMLRHMGYSVNVVEAEFHYYLLYTLPQGQIIIDPTIRQFFKGARAPPSIPQVFVGTIDQLNKLFQDNAAHKGGKYPMSRIYFKDAQVRDERMAELERDWRREDLVPLARFLSAVRHN